MTVVDATPLSATTAPVPFARTHISSEARAAVQRVLESGWVTTGAEVGEFEREFAHHVGAPRAVAVSSCTAAIELALRALQVRPGGRVLVSAMTFCGAVHAIKHAGLCPVLVDVDPVTAMPSPATTAAAVRSVGKADAMLVVHLAGLPAAVAELAEAAGLPLDLVVEDAAHALGTRVGGDNVGTISRATCFSFYATKNLPIGEGGMVTTADDELADRLLQARLHGMSKDAWRRYLPGGGWRYDVEAPGLKANMTDVQAAIGRAQLRHFTAWQRRRAELAARYDAGLAGEKGIALPPRPLQGRHAWHLYVVRVGDGFGVTRDELVDMLGEQGIGTSVHFIPLHQMTYFRQASVVPADGLPGADRVFEQILSLPMHQLLSDDDVDGVCAAIRRIGAGRAARTVPSQADKKQGAITC